MFLAWLWKRNNYYEWHSIDFFMASVCIGYFISLCILLVLQICVLALNATVFDSVDNISDR